jgi:uncharacterized protein (TIGR02186 family)
MKKLAAIICLAVATPPVMAAEISIALTDDLIRVDTGFTGARLTLFGAVTGVDNPEETVEVISVIRGPQTRFKIRQLEQKNLIWMPGDSHRIESAPGLYLTNATRPISDIAPLPDQAAYHLGTDFLGVNASASPDNHSDNEIDEHEQLFAKAFLSEIKSRGLYRDRIGGIEFKKGALFTINVNLPANTPVGDYNVSVYLYRNGAYLAHDSAQLAVNKVGIERQIYELAHTRPVSYGIFSVALSLFAGWVASLAFRK